MHLRSLERFAYDSVLLPYNFTLISDTAYRASFEELLALCGERGVAVQTIKSIARRRWPEPNAAGAEHLSWYEPLDDEGAITRAVRYVLARAELYLISSSDFRTLRSVLTAAVSAAPPPDDDELERDTETFGILPLFDGAALERI